MADNASNNDTCLKSTGKEIDPEILCWDPVERRVRWVSAMIHHILILPDTTFYRCMEHSIHVAGGHFITAFGPTSSRNVLQKVKRAFKNASGDDSNLDVEQLGVELDGVVLLLLVSPIVRLHNSMLVWTMTLHLWIRRGGGSEGLVMNLFQRQMRKEKRNWEVSKRVGHWVDSTTSYSKYSGFL